ncbi:hypothetical protein HNR65_002172 [Desulfosalsimonas propionicica]|uniref:Tip attachment protein J domain-containing protein n=1 Tax=Desulfosalsimonas propionicica TaxID=332175 RepID=A0A7W0HL85_9BACT|nr:phage tail protein [Desulfosalsimonas propionicica]MBA2881841.1 hypothetical protein [Desulfosalsimonas propionicica]
MVWQAVAWAIVKFVIAMAIAYMMQQKPKFDRPNPAGLDAFQVPTAEVGRPFGVLFGRKAFKSQNVVWYGDLGIDEIEEKVSTGMFSSTKITKGYKYFLGMHMVLCHDLDRILQISIDGDVLWTGDTGSNGDVATINKPGFFGGESDGGGIEGNLKLLRGMPDQQPDPYLQSQLGNHIPAFRGVATAVLSGRKYKAIGNIDMKGNGGAYLMETGVYAGAPLETWTLECIEEVEGGGVFSVTGSVSGSQGTASLNNHYDNGIVEFTVKNFFLTLQFGVQADFSLGDRITFSVINRNMHGFSGMYFGTSEYLKYWVIWGEKIYDTWYPEKAQIGSDGDMNPAHILYELITSRKFGMGYDPSDIDDTAFRSAADTLYNEGFGLSMLWDHGSEIEDFVGELLKHIDASCYTDVHTGKFTLKLIRNDYDINTLPIFNESNVTAVSSFRRRTLEEISNSVTIKFWDRQTGNTGSITRADIAMVSRVGTTVNTEINYPGVANKELAEFILSRDLRALSTPMASAVINTTQEGLQLSPGDPFVFSWDRYGVTETVMRVAAVQYGEFGDANIRIECVEDVFAIASATYQAPPPSGWVSPKNDPAPCPVHVAIETPYYKVARKIGATETAALPASTGYASLAGGKPSGDASSMEVHYSDDGTEYELEETKRFAPYAILAQGAIRTNAVLQVSWQRGFAFAVPGTWGIIDDEIVRIDAVTDNTVQIGRGCLDTVADEHSAGAYLVLISDWLATRQQGNNDGDTIYAKALPRTLKGTLDIDDATARTIEMNSRMIRPYPPARMQLNGKDEPGEVIGDISLAWRHRDRTQQLAADLYADGQDVNIGPETGTTYAYELRKASDGTLLASASGLSGTSETILFASSGFNGEVILTLWSERDGYQSWQKQQRQFYHLESGARITARSEFRITEDGEARRLEG